ncbi:hypothetical protein DYG62_13915 [Yersinia enterocolitica]|nr:hypothetical protein [Yersinia enterocolitica]
MVKTNYLTTYDGPIFDVQAHAIKPSTLQMTLSLISGASFLSDATKHIIVSEILTAAADLRGSN